MAPAAPASTRSTALLAIWLATVLAGFGWLTDYGARPSDLGALVASWPDDAGLARDATREDLLMFAHALCPCTDASLSELERVLADADVAPQARLVLWSDADQPERFRHSRLRERALAMPGVDVLDDPDGRLSAEFGAATSGTVLLFDEQGQRLFAGGITAGRGHEGDNVGAQRLRLALADGGTAQPTAPVFGCSLEARPSPPPEEVDP